MNILSYFKTGYKTDLNYKSYKIYSQHNNELLYYFDINEIFKFNYNVLLRLNYMESKILFYTIYYNNKTNIEHMVMPNVMFNYGIKKLYKQKNNVLKYHLNNTYITYYYIIQNKIFYKNYRWFIFYSECYINYKLYIHNFKLYKYNKKFIKTQQFYTTIIFNTKYNLIINLNHIIMYL